MKPRVLVFAYQEVGFQCLKLLFEQQVHVIAVYTHYDDPDETVWFQNVAELAKQHKIPVFYQEKINQPESIVAISELKPDLIFSFYYRNMISEKILALPNLGAFNMHGSLLPKYRGRAPINWAIIHGEKQTGATLHKMVKRADAGDIVDQQAVIIEPLDNAHQLTLKVVEAAKQVLQRQLPALLKGSAPNHKQDENQATYFSGRKPEDGRIDWHQSAQSIFNLVRAVTHPFPGTFTDYNQQRLLIWWALPCEGQGQPGEIINLNPLRVACGEDALELQEYQWQNDVFDLTLGEKFGEPENALSES